MPAKTFSATATITSDAGQLLQTSLNLTTAKTQTFNKDSVQATYVVNSGGSQKVYEPTEATNPLVYVFVQAATTNPTGSANELALVYSGSAISAPFAKLKPGDWTYLPYSSSASNFLTVTNPGASSATVLVMFAESGSE